MPYKNKEEQWEKEFTELRGVSLVVVFTQLGSSCIIMIAVSCLSSQDGGGIVMMRFCPIFDWPENSNWTRWGIEVAESNCLQINNQGSSVDGWTVGWRHWRRAAAIISVLHASVLLQKPPLNPDVIFFSDPDGRKKTIMIRIGSC